MKQEQVTEGKKYIAKFMGGKLIPYPQSIFKEVFKFTVKQPYIPGNMFPIKFLMYNSSWDWLMPVIRKIEKTNMGTIEIKSRGDVSLSMDGQTYSFYSGTLIENAFEAVLFFVKWYFLQTKHEEIEK